MVIVAVAGGTGGVGRAVVEQLQISGKHQFFVLGRKPPSPALPGAPSFLEVDYENVDALVNVLEEHSIDTVISALNPESEKPSNAQINLIAAADKSKTTQRFVPSEYFTPVDKNNLNESFGEQYRLANAIAIEKSGLEYIRIYAGLFMDYWAMPNVHSYMMPFSPGIDMSLKKAVVPGRGNDVMSMTYTIDLARFIVRLLDEPNWPKTASISGTDATFNEIIALLEKYHNAKFEVIYDDVEKLKSGDATFVSIPDESSGIPVALLKQMTVAFSLMVVSGVCALPKEGRLNDMFPELRLTTVEELLAKAWAKN
ncbi:NmrA-like family protein [Colletotrichum chrysophilum]|uniref:NmrA-like family protein n=1 Tax=Colletotrichum chrysophilum TaxID=1836956 RepID=A0AAD9AUN8_9PEZI|nr:NmrA-like family protein [Colletotrichum chrysophilum]